MALGEKLRNTRLKRNLTTSQVAAATRMKVQMVEDLEREDFSHIAAPIYGKGFIRMYAQHIGLDPAPLIDEYLERTTGKKPPSLRRASTPVTALPVEETRPPAKEPPAEETPAGEEAEPDLFTRPEPFSEPPARSDEPSARRVDLSVRLRAIAAAASDATGAAWRATVAGSRQGWDTLKRKVIALRSARPNIRLSRTPLTFVSIGIATLVVLVFIGSCLSRYVGDRDPGATTPVRDSDADLEIEAEPPDLYLDEPIGSQTPAR